MGLCGSKHDLPPPKQSNAIGSISNPASITNSGKSNTPNSVCVNQGANDINKDKFQKSERNNSVAVQSFNEKDSYNNNNRNRQNSSLSKSNDSTEKSISKVANKPLTQAKILLLGSGESGKSTILKQIKIIHQNGFSDNEKFDYKPFVYQNICESAQCIIKALQKYDLTSNIINLTGDELETLLNYQVPLEIDVKTSSLDPIIADLIEKLISDQTVIDLLSKKEYEFYILDSSSYFFENLERIKGKDYLPTVTDILRTRKQTSGIFDTKFQMEDLDIHLFDVGGQRSERKKWIHCFDNVTAIIFCVALSEYDQTLLESPNQNRLEESLNLFESVVNSMWFRRTAVILCLNKIDIFIEKLPNSPMENHFPDYVGGANVNKAVKYILWRFKQLNRANLNLVPYVSQATDTNNIRLAFAIVRETILHNNLLDSGIINS